MLDYRPAEDKGLRVSSGQEASVRASGANKKQTLMPVLIYIRNLILYKCCDFPFH